MNSEFPSTPKPLFNEEERRASGSRFMDEKISDDSGTETQTNSALAPAGLKNPFWK